MKLLNKLIIGLSISTSLLFASTNNAFAYNGPNEIVYTDGTVENLDNRTACNLDFSDVYRVNDIYIYTDDYTVEFYNASEGWSTYYELYDPFIEIRNDYGDLLAYSGSCLNIYSN